MALGHYENFPVASILLPRRMRPHIAAIYAFARIADDIADEPGPEPDERLRLLDDLHHQLHAPAVAQHGRTASPVFVALHETIAHLRLPVPLFDDLLSAFRQDVLTNRYETWEDVLDYCRRSANPIGRLVLRVAGVENEVTDRASDAVCTALQLTNFWQDLGRDWRNGRLYVPAEEARRHAAAERGLDASAMPPEWRAAIAACVARTRGLFDQGRPVAAAVGGRLRLELRATWLGGVRVLDKIEALGCDTLHQRPKLGAADAVRIAVGVARWR
jgi:squalene synthase HpnC